MPKLVLIETRSFKKKNIREGFEESSNLGEFFEATSKTSQCHLVTLFTQPFRAAQKVKQWKRGFW